MGGTAKNSSKTKDMIRKLENLIFQNILIICVGLDKDIKIQAVLWDHMFLIVRV